MQRPGYKFMVAFDDGEVHGRRAHAVRDDGDGTADEALCGNPPRRGTWARRQPLGRPLCPACNALLLQIVGKLRKGIKRTDPDTLRPIREMARDIDEKWPKPRVKMRLITSITSALEVMRNVDVPTDVHNGERALEAIERFLDRNGLYYKGAETHAVRKELALLARAWRRKVDRGEV